MKKWSTGFFILGMALVLGTAVLVLEGSLFAGLLALFCVPSFVLSTFFSL